MQNRDVNITCENGFRESIRVPGVPSWFEEVGKGWWVILKTFKCCSDHLKTFRWHSLVTGLAVNVPKSIQELFQNKSFRCKWPRLTSGNLRFNSLIWKCEMHWIMKCKACSPPCITCVGQNTIQFPELRAQWPSIDRESYNPILPLFFTGITNLAPAVQQGWGRDRGGEEGRSGPVRRWVQRQQYHWILIPFPGLIYLPGSMQICTCNIPNAGLSWPTGLTGAYLGGRNQMFS